MDDGTRTTARGGGLREEEAWALLSSVRGLGPATFAAVLGRFGSARAVLDAASRADGRRGIVAALAEVRGARSEESAPADGVEGVVPAGPMEAQRPPDRGDPPHRPPERARRTRSARRADPDGGLADRIAAAGRGAEAFAVRVRDLGLSIVTLDSPDYPGRLRAIALPPPVLYVRGERSALGGARAVAVVGTRRPTDHGRRVASRIAGAAARRGAAVVSGLAVGIDGAAHAAALTERGVTVAVLGGGHGRIYPHAHERLAGAIADAGGAVVAELPPDTAAVPGTFPRRNRLISGLADATVVVEAAARSGALITARWALEQGRGCFAVPGPIDAPSSAGCLALLRDWPGEARIVAGVDELLEDLGYDHADAGGSPGLPSGVDLEALGAFERTVAASLASGHATVDDIVGATDLPVASVLVALTLLEIRGLVVGSYGRYLPAGRLATMPARGIGEFAAPSCRVLP